MEGGRAKRKPPDYDMVQEEEEEEEEETVAHFPLSTIPLSTRPSPPSISSSREHVMSEVHLGCPPHFSGPYISRFTFRPPPSEPDATEEMCNELVEGAAPMCQMLCLDDDGDLVLSRPSKTSINCGVSIQHKITSAIPSVGLQVWRAAMVLADFVLHTIFTSSDFNNIVALELGAGTGLVGILVARVARTVFLTDCDDEILGNCATNADLNSRMFKYGASVHVRELDWKKSWPPTPSADKCHFPSQQGSKYLWTPSEIEEAEGASVILAADVIYSDDLTDAFFNTLAGIMSHGSEKVLYLALEKRYNFSIDDLDVVANGYSHFRSYLRDGDECRTLGDGMPCFVGKLVHLAQIPQYIREYDRGNDLEIWEIKYSSFDTISHRKESKISV